MVELILFIGFIGFVVVLFRFMRKREIEAFMEADLSEFQGFASGRDDVEVVATPQEDVAAATNVVSLTSARPVREPDIRFTARDSVFDEIHRNFLAVLEQVLDNRFRVFVHVPLSDFLRVEAGNIDLRQRAISFLVCDRDKLRISCGIMLQGASPTEVAHFKFLEEAFGQIEKPLVTFPMLTEYSHKEVNEKLGEALKAALKTRTCPQCGGDMVVRKATKGANAGKSFWVCKEFPSCKGIMRVGRW